MARRPSSGARKYEVIDRLAVVVLALAFSSCWLVWFFASRARLARVLWLALLGPLNSEPGVSLVLCTFTSLEGAAPVGGSLGAYSLLGYEDDRGWVGGSWEEETA